MPVGSLVNAATILIGSTIGLLLRRGLPPRFRGIIFQGIGLVTIVIGVLNALAIAEPVPDTQAVPLHLLVVVFSILIGGILGEWCQLERRMNRLGDWLKARVKSDNAQFTTGLVTAFLIYCIGPMTILGSLNEGMRGDASLLYVKAVLDGFMSIALVSTFGIGVAFAAIPLLIFQYALTLVGILTGETMDPVIINQLTAVGGILILGLGINILELRELRVTNLLPALVVVVLLTVLLG